MSGKPETLQEIADHDAARLAGERRLREATWRLTSAVEVRGDKRPDVVALDLAIAAVDGITAELWAKAPKLEKGP